MKRAHVALMFVAVTFTANSLGAQDTGSVTASGDGSEDASIISTIRIAFDRPLHPIVKGVAPGGGVGIGLEYDVPSRGRWHTTARGVITMRRYWSADFGTGYRGDRAQVEVYGRARDMSQLSFFGPGTNSDQANRANFRLRDPVIGGLALVHVGRWFAVGGRAEAIWPDVGRGRSSTEPSIEQLFDESDVPGWTAQPRFGRYEALAEVHVPPAAGEALHQGAKYRIAYAIFDDRQLNQFTFRRVDVEGQQRFALLYPHHRLTLHGWLSTTETDAGDDVPFYFQRTLGGRGAIRSVHEDLIGSDGTRATLRSFRSLRFRDRHLLLLQAEYRVPVWGPLDVTVFTDAGKVTSRREDLNLSDLKRSHGFSLSVMRGPAAMTRMDVAFGGGEGTRVLVAVGGDFLP